MKYLKNKKKAGGQKSDDKKVFANRKAKSFKVELGKLSSMLQSRHLFMASLLKWGQGGVKKREEKALGEVK